MATPESYLVPGVLKPGCIEPVEYFVRGSDGHLILAAYSGQPAPDGYVADYADTLRAVERLERELQEQDHRANEMEYAAHMEKWAAGREAIRDRLLTALTSSSRTEYEKDFIRAWIALRDDEKKTKYENAWLQRTMYLHALHFDTPKDRRVDEEAVNLDRINF